MTRSSVVTALVLLTVGVALANAGADYGSAPAVNLRPVERRLAVEHFSAGRGNLADGPPADVPDGWELVGPADPKFIMDVTIALKLKNVPAIMALFKEVSDPRLPGYGKYMSRDELADFSAPPAKDSAEVHSWLMEGGALTAELSDSRDFIRATATVAVVETLFSSKLYEYRNKDSGDRMVRGGGGYTVPVRVHDFIDVVGGLVRFPATKGPRIEVNTFGAEAEDIPVTTPKLIRELHNMTKNVDGERNPDNVQVIVSFLDQYVLDTDTSSFMDKFGESDRRVRAIEKVIGPNDPSKPGEEASLDVQYLMGVAKNVRTWIWSYGGIHEKQEPFLEWLADVSDAPKLPSVFSISYQDYEPTVSQDYMDRVNLEFVKLGLRGVTMVTGSGDWGAGCTATCDRFFADFPSSSPYITSLGATELTSAALAQQGVGFSSGGFSEHFERPGYQNLAVQHYIDNETKLKSFYNASGRAFPDLSTIGVKFQVYVNGTVMPIGGTSAATPTFAAMVSILNDARLKAGRPTMGFVNPFLYQSAEDSADAFVDIVSGTQTPYQCCKESFSAVQGWDPMTGLGTPNFDRLYELAMRDGPIVV